MYPTFLHDTLALGLAASACFCMIPALVILFFVGVTGVSRQGAFPMGRFAFGGGLSVSYVLLGASLLVCAACLAALHALAMDQAIVICAAAAMFGLSFPMLLKVFTAQGVSRVARLALCDPPSVAELPGSTLCIPWEAIDKKTGELLAAGFCVSSARLVQARIESLARAKLAALASYGIPFIRDADGNASQAWNAPKDGVQWLSDLRGGKALLVLEAPRRLKTAQEVAAWAVRALDTERLEQAIDPTLEGNSDEMMQAHERCGPIAFAAAQALHAAWDIAASIGFSARAPKAIKRI